MLSVDLPRSVSKKHQLRDSLKAQIMDSTLPHGTKLPSTAVFAREWNVAHATAHAALNELSREGWLVRYSKRGTFVSHPQDSKSRELTKNVAVVIPPRQSIAGSSNGDIVFEVLQGLTEGAQNVEWILRIEQISNHPSDRELKKTSSSLASSLTSILIGGGAPYTQLTKLLEAAKLPVVSILGDPGYGDVVTYDQGAAVKKCLEYLIARGGRRIGFFGYASDDKLSIFNETMRRHNLPTTERAIRTYASPREAYGGIKEFFSTPPDCDALFVDNYRLGSAVVQQALQRGLRVPEDLAVLALGIETPETTDAMPLSYLRVPYLECGKAAIKLLANSAGVLLDKKRKINVPFELILRESA